MKVLILAAGYGTRLEKDLEKTESHKDLIGIPKPLLPIAGSPLISHWMRIITNSPPLSPSDVHIVVNDSNIDKFTEWSREHYPQVKMVSDGTNCNDNRIGAVACIATAVRHFNINDDLLVIGGDTLFYEDFKLNDFMRKFESKCSQVKGAMVTRCLCGDHETTKYGILEIDADDRVTSFLEKPPPHLTNSRFSCPCFYVFTSHVLPLLHQFLEDHKDFPLAQRDAPGNFIKYLFLTNTPLYTYPVTGRHDVGNLESYIKCNMEYIPNY